MTSRLSRTLRRIRESSAPPVSSPFLRSRPFSPPAHVSKRPITGCGAFRANVWIRVGEREGTKDEWDRAKISSLVRDDFPGPAVRQGAASCSGPLASCRFSLVPRPLLAAHSRIHRSSSRSTPNTGSLARTIFLFFLSSSRSGFFSPPHPFFFSSNRFFFFA